MTVYAMCCTDFKKLKTTADYESVIRNSVDGMPEHWIPEVAKQCVDSSPSPQGRRHASNLAPDHVSIVALAVQSACESHSCLSAEELVVMCCLSCDLSMLCPLSLAHYCKMSCHSSSVDSPDES